MHKKKGAYRKTAWSKPLHMPLSLKRKLRGGKVRLGRHNTRQRVIETNVRLFGKVPPLTNHSPLRGQLYVQRTRRLMGRPATRPRVYLMLYGTLSKERRAW